MRLQLNHLTFVGPEVSPAAIEFGPVLTLVRGPSDTGKSFIVDAIDFMLGANSLKEIPERSGYTTVLLGLTLPDGETVTLSRSVRGGGFGLYRSDVRSTPVEPFDENLAQRHDTRNTANISRFLLSAIGLDGSKVRRNQRNETSSLSFRDIAHFCVISETKIQDALPPVFTGTYTTRTKELSVFKLLLQGEDDSSLVPEPNPMDDSRLRAVRAEVFDRLIADLENRLSQAGGKEELLSRLEQLMNAVSANSESIASLADEQDRQAREYSVVQRRASTIGNRLRETEALTARFSLLLQQYDSDLARLEMIEEAGDLLGYFKAGVCPFCGANPEDQHLNAVCDGDTAHLRESVSAERNKTTQLRSDLSATIGDLIRERSDLISQLEILETRIARARRVLSDLGAQLRPQRANLNELLQEHNEIEKALALDEQISDLRRERDAIDTNTRRETSQAASNMELRTVNEFSQELARRLEAWNYPSAQGIRYDRAMQDIVAGDQFREAHGKGVRAILHAAFTIALAEYCIQRDFPHPGFVVLDSPLVTYRAPDQITSDSGNDEELSDAVASAFYSDLETSFSGQVVILENIDPPRPLLSDSIDVHFTKSSDDGRYGFFPS